MNGCSSNIKVSIPASRMFQKMFDEVMDTFDFEFATKVLLLEPGRFWLGGELFNEIEIPFVDLSDIKFEDISHENLKCAEILLRKWVRSHIETMMEEGTEFSGTGGFEFRINKDQLGVQLIPTYVDVYTEDF